MDFLKYATCTEVKVQVLKTIMRLIIIRLIVPFEEVLINNNEAVRGLKLKVTTSN